MPLIVRLQTLIRCLLVAALTSVILAVPAKATPGEVREALGEARPLGSAVFRWLGVPLYEATLFTPGRASFGWQTPLALQLVYARSLSGEVLVEATIAELERIEGTRPDHARMAKKLDACFRDVAKGDRYVAVAAEPDRIGFWLNGRQTCDLRHPEARQRILGIWLSDDSRSVEVARRLRGE
jgi:hypothetical protein